MENCTLIIVPMGRCCRTFGRLSMKVTVICWSYYIRMDLITIIVNVILRSLPNINLIWFRQSIQAIGLSWSMRMITVFIIPIMCLISWFSYSGRVMLVQPCCIVPTTVRIWWMIPAIDSCMPHQLRPIINFMWLRLVGSHLGIASFIPKSMPLL